MKVKEIKNYCLHGVYLLFHNKSDTLHYLFAIPSAFTLSRELELSKNLTLIPQHYNLTLFISS